ncbi:hypothetical protein N7448_008944 [Penicillium atrosanguineum]|uniref:Berberine/berberine-like domain-containing protein n=1 Tax=Penicillium atrosanguineum TaxID=1132637 RepID=A0A9W9GSF6_9EURO|nr:uncharacterized protein N7443_000028 [Penicillium atrosanguineum]KAJ5128165.1 hypothetical protein N7448_008944 [Penicillium atrosanguineum]KAJ5148397.1 hypothetical protein N7526_001749 [Penicillium atrosanguineum]KAJ5313144.1 hypothetical protein N7443_000028 [Penicillium atrosanguineum]KAJ5330250.1 hypothetical protein N7476_000033 [Penicillium atrosanguineum]
MSTLFLKGAWPTGDATLLASGLYSRDLMISQDSPERLTNAWKSLRYDPRQALAGCVVAGGAVTTNGDIISSAKNYFAYDTLKKLECQCNSQRAACSCQKHHRSGTADHFEGTDQMGAYVNEAFAYEPDIQTSLWGNGYSRLYRIKQVVDPTGLFIVRRGVGSED